MSQLNYEGAMEDWKVRLIETRARQLGFRDADLDDAMQDCVWELLGFTFQAEKARQATEKTVYYAVIDRILRTLRFRRLRHTSRFVHVDDFGTDEGLDVSGAGESEMLDKARSLDLAAAIEELTARSQSLCAALAEGASLRESAKRLGWSWREVENEVAVIRRHFAERGLDGWLV